jgi:hypothetical protein
VPIARVFVAAATLGVLLAVAPAPLATQPPFSQETARRPSPGPDLDGRSATERFAVDRPALLEDLRRLSADDMQGRAAGTEGGARARAYLLERFREAGLVPPSGGFERPFPLPLRGGTTAGQARTGVNVLGLVPGTRTPDLYIVVSAHYDHVGVRGGRVFNGANDNASGAAALPAIARHFVRHRPSVSVLFAAFDAEEIGLLGARAFVSDPPVDRAGLLANLNLDMIGRSPDNILYVVGAHGQPALRPIVERVAPAVDLTLRMDYDGSTARDDWSRDSDQYAFMQAGIPALFLSVEDFAHHHEPTDDYETMSYDFYVDAVEAAIALVEELDRSVDVLRRIERR